MIALSELLVTKQQSLEESSLLAAVLFGGQINDYDYHMAGFSEVILTKLLNDVSMLRLCVSPLRYTRISVHRWLILPS